MPNPLLETDSLPKFSQIKPEHFIEAIDVTLADYRKFVDEVVQQENFTFDNLIKPLEEQEARLEAVFSPISHLASVKDSEELRKAHDQVIPKLSEHSSWLGQHEGLYQAFVKLSLSEEYSNLNFAQKKIINDEIRDFKLSGVSLNEEDKKKYQQLQLEKSQLSVKFSENVLDARKAWTMHLEDDSRLKDMPEHALEMFKQFAKDANLTGYLITLDFPSYYAIVSYCKDRNIREEVYTAYQTTASELGPNPDNFDNGPIMEQIVAKRRELANLLGFNDYAEYSLATKMATSKEEVLDFLNELAIKSKQIALNEFSEIKKLAKEQDSLDEVQAWDITFYSTILQKQRFGISQEELREYFPEDKVFQGLFEVVRRLYGLNIKELAKDDFDAWDDDVRFFEVYDEDGSLRGKFYTDLYARTGKKGGAWMGECRSRTIRTNGLQYPVAYLCANFSKPAENMDSYLTHEEAQTLFHEFGHTLHHLLTKQDYISISGINGVSWDAVELPSQFMENWIWEKEVIDLVSLHKLTKKPLPNEMFENLKSSKKFQAAMQMLRQVEFALFDFELHIREEIKTKEDIQNLMNEIRQRVSVVRTPDFNRFQNSFSHIFAGGYAAGYYSYKWAEVLSSDAFELFEEEGIFNKDTGKKFMGTILEMGASKEAMELYKEFRGREPKIDALLHQAGIC